MAAVYKLIILLALSGVCFLLMHACKRTGGVYDTDGVLRGSGAIGGER